MKGKMYFLVLGFFIGAIVAVLGIFLYVKFTDRSTMNNGVLQMDFERGGDGSELPDENSPGSKEALDKPGDDEEPPVIPNGEGENDE